MHTPRPSLDQPLPDDVVVGGGYLWTRYRQYPVFSARWLAGRALLFGSVILAFSVMSLLAVLMTGASTRGALVAAGHTFVAFMLMTCAGPSFATATRHLRLPLRRERVLVVVALLLGIAVSFVVDRWASTHLDAFMQRELGQPSFDVEAVRARFETPAARVLGMLVQLMVLGFIYGLLGGGAALRGYFLEQRRLAASRERLALLQMQARARETELRLGTLQAQVEPHFLFNTLASVRALVRRDAGRAEATLDALVDYLRATIPQLREDGANLESTLGQQLDLCARYLELMRLRTADRLGYDIQVAPELRALPYPPLLLLTLAENAVKHGVEPKPGAGHIRISAWLEAQSLHVRVSDDGAGLQPGVGGGMGLANVREQLSARFGDRASLRLTGASSGGAQAEIRIPLESTCARS